MKRLKSWLLVLGTVLLIGTGAAMPWAAARFQDRYGVAAQEVWPFDPVSLTLRQDSEIGAVLRIMSGPYDLAEWSGETRMDRTDACMAAFDALTRMGGYELLESGYIRIYDDVEPGTLDRMKETQMCDAWPALLIAQDGSSAVVWTCWWTDPAGPQYQLMVDDATGLAVSGYFPCAYQAGTELLYQRMQRWWDFFEDYYGIEILDVRETAYDAATEFTYRFDLEDGLGSCGLLVTVSRYEMVLDACAADSSALLPQPTLPEDRPGWEAESNTAAYTGSRGAN